MITTLFEEVAANLTAAGSGEYDEAVERAVEMMVDAFRNGNQLLVFGNGGSSSDAQHICGELVGRFLKERRALPAIALSANQAVLTAWSNDYCYEEVFARQVEAHGRPGDIAWGISTSGNSKNVVAALEAARRAGMRTIGMTGQGGGAMAACSDALLAAPQKSTPRIQEIHLVTYHYICAAIEERLFN